MLNNTLTTTNSGFQAQLDAAASKWQVKEKARDEALAKARNQIAAQDQAVNKSREENSKLSTKVEALQQNKSEDQAAQKQHLSDIASEEEEMQKFCSQHAAELAEKVNEINELHKFHTTATDSKDVDIEAVKADFTRTLTATANEQLGQLTKEAKTLTATNNE